MSRLVTDAELVMRDHVVSKSLSPYWRRVEMGLPLNPEYLKQQMKRNAQTPLGLEVPA